MYDFLAPRLTNPRGYAVNWHPFVAQTKGRTQETFFELWTHYSSRELFIRGGLVVTLLLCGMLVAHTCPRDCEFPLVSGFFGTTALSLADRQRVKIKSETNELFKKINCQLTSLSSGNPSHKKFLTPLLTQIQSKTASLFEYSCPVTKRVGVVRRLRDKKLLMQKILGELERLEQDLTQEKNEKLVIKKIQDAQNFWEQGLDKLVQDLLGDQKKSTHVAPQFG